MKAWWTTRCGVQPQRWGWHERGRDEKVGASGGQDGFGLGVLCGTGLSSTWQAKRDWVWGQDPPSHVVPRNVWAASGVAQPGLWKLHLPPLFLGSFGHTLSPLWWPLGFQLHMW
jgi:hypothetical protein